MTRIVLRVVAVAVCAATPAAGQIPNSVPLVLSLPPTVRSAALNGAATALVGDAGAVFANPAGLATIRHTAIEGAYRLLPTAEAFVGTAALAWRIRQFDFGLGLRFADLGTSPHLYGIGQAGSDAREALGAGSAVYRRGILALGATAKQIRRSVDGQEVRGHGMDAGFALAFFDIMAIGFSMQNLGGNLDETSPLVLPSLSRFGFTMNYVDPQESFRLLSVLEVQWPEGQGSRLVIGGEGGVVLEGVGVVARIGYGSRSPFRAGAASDFAYGATIELPAARFDYAYRRRDLMDEPAHQFGVRLRL